MDNVTQILAQIEIGEAQAAGDLLPIIYHELRTLAQARMASERPDHTLQATALVHEAYIRLMGAGKAQHWDNRGHFFAAAAEAMRRILVEHARGKARLKRGAGRPLADIDALEPAAESRAEVVVQVHEAVDRLAEQDPQAAEWIKLRFFVGLSTSEAAELLGVAPSTAFLHWSYAKAALRRLME